MSAPTGGRRGRPRLPDSVHRVRGTFREDRHGAKQGIKLGASDKTPTIPTGFNEQQEKIWRAVQREMKAIGLWSSTFTFKIELFVRTYVRYRKLEDDIEKNGLIYTIPSLDKNNQPQTYAGPDGKEYHVLIRRTNPAQLEIGKVLPQLRGLLADLGLSPVALSRLEVEAKEHGRDDLSIVG